jgi:hypothetical protein
MFLEQYLVVAIAHVVGQLGLQLEYHGPLIHYDCHSEVFGGLNDKVGVVVSNGGQVAIRKIRVKTYHVSKLQE